MGLAGDRRSDDHGRPSRNVVRRDGVIGRSGLASGGVGGTQHVDMMVQSRWCVGQVVDGEFDVKDASATGLYQRVLYRAPRSSELLVWKMHFVRHIHRRRVGANVSSLMGVRHSR